jgi:protein gp37
MATRIEWCDETWNPVTGCAPISEGCDNCYAQRMANRLRGRYGYPAEKPFRVTWHADRLAKPERWRRPRRIFVCSMGDLFHGDVRVEWIDKMLAVMAECPQHTFMVLTKRAMNIESKLYGEAPCRFLGAGGCLPNLWLGVTAENQFRADKNVAELLKIPAALRFVSAEPLLGPVDLVSAGLRPMNIDWVICGGETGPGARLVHPDWVRSLRDQCVAAGVPFFFKGWGDVGPLVKPYRRVLDGREWNEVPC